MSLSVLMSVPFASRTSLRALGLRVADRRRHRALGAAAVVHGAAGRPLLPASSPWLVLSAQARAPPSSATAALRDRPGRVAAALRLVPRRAARARASLRLPRRGAAHPNACVAPLHGAAQRGRASQPRRATGARPLEVQSAGA